MSRYLGLRDQCCCSSITAGRTLEVAALSLRDARNSHGSSVTAAITYPGNRGPPGRPRAPREVTYRFLVRLAITRPFLSNIFLLKAPSRRLVCVASVLCWNGGLPWRAKLRQQEESIY